MATYNNREDEPCPDGECKHSYDDWPAGSVTQRDLDIDQCANCGWTETGRKLASAERSTPERRIAASLRANALGGLGWH